MAEAEADAARAIGEGEAAATRIANEAHAADPEFYQFLKTLETYRAALDQKTMLVLSAESPFLKLLTQGLPDLQPAQTASLARLVITSPGVARRPPGGGTGSSLPAPAASVISPGESGP